MLFDWDDLKFFLAVARAKKLTVAARRLHTDHSTVSRRIRELEHALEAALFERSPRGYSMTAEGRHLLRHAEEMERIAVSVQDDISGTRSLLSGTVRVGVPDGFGTIYLAPNLAELCKEHRELEVQIAPVPMNFSISNREADIVIAMRQPTEGRLASRLLTRYRLRLYAATDYLERHPPILSLADAAQHLLVGHIPDLMFSPQQDYFPELSAMSQPRLSISSSVAQMKATKAGAGLCMISDFMATGEQGLSPILSEETSTIRELWLVTSVDFQNVRRIRAVIDHIVACVKRDRELFMPSG